ncbi:ATP-dependent RecD-like DNA helicase [Amorphus sp. 3PC139-8]|uniref:ATP-dependent DNA helicase n=1 Tax=Amorphus sp. 3PC139-8 TaxID=2735676 RepID=UPI00345D984F
MKFSPQQDSAMKAVRDWLRSGIGGPQSFYLAGYAGTGKTTLARHLAEHVGKAQFAAFTGKAALMLQSKGCEGARTIHSLIYRIDEDGPEPAWRLNVDSPIADADLVVIDEVSMVGPDLGRDLMSFGRPILVLGDPAQLPPVRGEGFFTSREPDFMLTEVHRQAQDNPIIAMSMEIREGGRLAKGARGESRVIGRTEIETGAVLASDQVIVGKNMTRRLYNDRIRELLEREGFFQPGDRVVALRNNKEKGLLNGGIWQVEKIIKQGDKTTQMKVSPLDAGTNKDWRKVITHHAWVTGEERSLDWKEAKQYDPFDYAYALTCHKAQGSQWDDVVVFDESRTFGEHADRWLYTAVMRAAETVTVVTT